MIFSSYLCSGKCIKQHYERQRVLFVMSFPYSRFARNEPIELEALLEGGKATPAVW